MGTNVDMNKRRTEILYYVLKSTAPVELSELSHLFPSEVSIRTIRDDIKGINCFLERNDLTPLLSRRDLTVEFTGSRQQREAAIEILCNQGDYYRYHLNSDERARVIVCHLINTDDYITHKDLCSVVVVSRGTLYTDMVNCEKVAAEFGLTITSTTGRGYRIEGPELNKRQAVSKLYKRWSDKGRSSNRVFYDILDSAEKHFGFILTDRGYTELMRYIKITVHRYASGHRLDVPESCRECSVTEFPYGQYLWDKLDEAFHLGQDKNEVMALEMQYRATVKLIARIPCSDQAVVTASNRFLLSVSEKLGADLAPGPGVLSRLFQYVDFLRYDPGDYSVFNTYLNRSLEKRHPDICRAVADSLYIITEFIGREPAGNQRIQLTLFVLSCAMRFSPLPQLYRTCVICDGGPGELEHLCTQLRALFPVEIVQTAASHTFRHQLTTPDADLVLTTVPIDGAHFQAICINNIMTLQDAERVQSFLIGKRYDSLYSQLIGTPKDNSRTVQVKL